MWHVIMWPMCDCLWQCDITLTLTLSSKIENKKKQNKNKNKNEKELEFTVFNSNISLFCIYTSVSEG